MPTVKEGYKEAIKLLQECSFEYGFYASLKELTNYKRVWSRDGVICGLAAIASEDEKLIDSFRRTLNTLLKYQGKQGEIPSNVDPQNNITSYGISAGRVDSSLWYIIGCGKYYRYTKDDFFLENHYLAMKKTIALLESWEFNRRGFIFVPESGDWADEMLRRGYLLYDQVLYYLALKEFLKLKEMKEKKCPYTRKKIQILGKKIKINFWPEKTKGLNKKYIYHQPTFIKLIKRRSFWIEGFDANTKRFDAFANSLAILSGLSSSERNEKTIKYIQKISKNKIVPAFYPVITKKSPEWKKLCVSYSFEFKNNPYLRHNGGLWPVVNGFCAMAFFKAGKKDLAQNILTEINISNFLHQEKNKKWGFYEYLHGKTKEPKGNAYMAWSAAGQIIAFNCHKNIL